MDLALETSEAAKVAEFKIDLDSYRRGDFAVFRKVHFLWLVPVWVRIKGYQRSVADAELWLRDNWKHPSYFKPSKVPK